MFDIFDFSFGTVEKCYGKEWIILKSLMADLYLAVESEGPMPAPVHVIKIEKEKE